MNDPTDSPYCTCDAPTGDGSCWCPIHGNIITQKVMDTMLKKPPFKAEPKPLTEEYYLYTTMSDGAISVVLNGLDAVIATINKDTGEDYTEELQDTDNWGSNLDYERWNWGIDFEDNSIQIQRITDIPQIATILALQARVKEAKKEGGAYRISMLTANDRAEKAEAKLDIVQSKSNLNERRMLAFQAENKRLREGHHFIASVSYMTKYKGRPAMDVIREKAQEMAGEKTL